MSSLGRIALLLPVAAHPSGFGTLTLDLFVGPRGLGAVDAAVVESKGPGYDPFSTTTASQTVGDLLAWTVGSGTPRST